MTTNATRHGKTDDRSDRHDRDRNVVVTITAPNNHPHNFTVNLHDRVDKVAREAVRFFVEDHVMEQMECSLTLVVDGVARPLEDGARLEDVGLHAKSRLALVPKKPKTDG